jgi:hypothetical protein|tara:strand:+ start:127 stop:309 length:183 start_codon:yes stop_codon:yes gene_type:complete
MINSINRKEAIKKMGKYATLTALGSFLILTPLSSQATSPDDCEYRKGFLTNWRCKKKKTR